MMSFREVEKFIGLKKVSFWWSKTILNSSFPELAQQIVLSDEEVFLLHVLTMVVSFILTMFSLCLAK